MSDINDSVYVFVYGTLRAGEINDMALAAQRHGVPAPQFVGAAAIPGTLHDFGDYPGWVPQTNAAAPVVGDIYRIAPALVAVLDEIEEVYPGEAGLFAKIMLPVACAGATYECIVYPVQAASAAGRPVIEGGDWVAYRLARRRRALHRDSPSTPHAVSLNDSSRLGSDPDAGHPTTSQG